MAVTVKYKDNIITEMTEDGTKTLLTAGKYCEDNFTVSHTAGESIEAKKWTVTVGSTSGTSATLLTDSWLAEHRSDENLCVAVLPNFAVPFVSGVGNQGMYLCTNMTRVTDSSGTTYPSMSLYVHSNGGVAVRVRPKTLLNGSNIGDLIITSAGKLQVCISDGYPLAAGEYTVLAFLS